MKKTILSLGMAAFFVVGSATFIGCGNAHEENETATEEAVEQDEAVYACPMHSEVTGHEGDQCSKCGMDLKEEE